MGVLEYWLINAPLHYSTTPVFQFQPTLDKLKGFNLEQKPNLAVGKEPHMFAKIRHVAAHTERYDSMAKFYQTIFGMKQITTGLVDETGQHNPNRGHISDGVIGMALLTKRPGSQQGLDHFGFECEDVKEVLDRIKQKYPELLFTKALSYVPFAGIRAQDPTGTQFDLSQKGMSNVREGYLKDGWEQPRWLNHIALRAREPDEVAEFYTTVLELEETPAADGAISLTDGKVRLLIRPCHDKFYRGLRQGFDHIGFKVDSVEKTKKELDEIAVTFPESAPKKIAVGMQGGELEKDLQACPIGKHVFADPDGVLLDISE
jgi:catechol 2,3-dioxygenase-like lactoylglutathione lyase family enzyme